MVKCSSKPYSWRSDQVLAWYTQKRCKPVSSCKVILKSIKHTNREGNKKLFCRWNQRFRSRRLLRSASSYPKVSQRRLTKVIMVSFNSYRLNQSSQPIIWSHDEIMTCISRQIVQKTSHQHTTKHFPCNFFSYSPKHREQNLAFLRTLLQECYMEFQISSCKVFNNTILN